MKITSPLWLKNITIPIVIAFFVIPIQTQATPCCVEYNSIRMHITSCRVVVENERCGSAGDPRYSGPGEWPFECEAIVRGSGTNVHTTFGDVTGGWGLCTEALAAANVPAPDAGEPQQQPVLPRLQVSIPGLTPFTNPFREPTVVTEGDKRVLYIDFLAVYISAIYRYLIGIVGIVAGIMIVWAGIKWLTAGGMPDRIGSAKKQIAGAIMGMIIALGAYVILFVVNPELTRLKPLRIEVVESIPLGLQEEETEEAAETPAIAGQERRIVSVSNEFMQNAMRVGEHLQETIQNVAQELHNETENMPGGPYKLAGGGYRALDVQVTKWKRQCEGRPTCGVPVCNPFGSAALDVNNRLLPGATPVAANCPHTTGQALDLRCSCPSTLDTQECNKYASTSPKFFAPCQRKLEEIMARKGFCRLRSEPWHFENPKMMGTCEAGLVGSAQRRRPAKSWSYQSCNGVYNMQTAECEPLPR